MFTIDQLIIFSDRNHVFSLSLSLSLHNVSTHKCIFLELGLIPFLPFYYLHNMWAQARNEEGDNFSHKVKEKG